VGGPAGASPKRDATSPPSATPHASCKNVSPAKARRDVPEERFFVASSVIAVVSVSPGKSTSSPARIVVEIDRGPMDQAKKAASSAATKAATASNTRSMRSRPDTTASRPIARPTSVDAAISRAPPSKKRAPAPDVAAKESAVTNAP
jgi:hypothetical protein